MACKDCGQQQVQPGPCRTFTFPLGRGSVELHVRGDVVKVDVEALRNFLALALDLLDGVLPDDQDEGETHG